MRVPSLCFVVAVVTWAGALVAVVGAGPSRLGDAEPDVAVFKLCSARSDKCRHGVKTMSSASTGATRSSTMPMKTRLVRVS